MAGICGWVGTGRELLRVDGEPVRRAMSHRGPIGWLDRNSPSARVTADSAFNAPESLAALWNARSKEPEAFASDLSGSFAVAALDEPGGRLLLARDRLGEKPLYYAATRSGVAFASEIKALRALAGTGAIPDLTISPDALDAYLAFTYIPAPATIFEQVRKVPAGHLVLFDLEALARGEEGAAGLTPYWILPPRQGETAAPGDIVDRLAAAIFRRLPASGRPACFLSGGLDSSVVAALMAREGLLGFPAFSIGFEEEDLDESSHARRVAKLVGAEHHLIRLRDVEPEMVAAVIDQLDEPMADAATIPSWVLARETEGIARVVMTGDGADALLAGDHWFRRLRRVEVLERMPRTARFLASVVGSPWRSLVSLLDLPPAARYLKIRQKWTPDERRGIYSGEFRRRVDQSFAADSYLRAPVEWRRGHLVEAAVRLDAIHGLPEGLLMKADKMGMAHGVESRSPFLDREFVEWAARLDIDLLLKGATTKYLLKKGAESLLPRDLVHRRKHGFQVPMGRWLKGPLRPLTEAAFDPAFVRRQGIFDGGALGILKGRFDGSVPPGPALTGQVWQIVAFQTWWRGLFERRGG